MISSAVCFVVSAEKENGATLPVVLMHSIHEMEKGYSNLHVLQARLLVAGHHEMRASSCSRGSNPNHHFLSRKIEVCNTLEEHAD
jgi:hypothetical protein